MTSPWQPTDSEANATRLEPTPRYGNAVGPGGVSPIPSPPAYGVPAYGVPTNGAPTFGVPTHGAPAYGGPGDGARSGARRKHPVDAAITTVLLTLGAIGAISGIILVFTVPSTLANAGAKYHLTYSLPANYAALATVVVSSHVVLYAAAQIISRRLIAARRIAFWAPLVAGVIATIILWTIVLSLIWADQALLYAVPLPR